MIKKKGQVNRAGIPWLCVMGCHTVEPHPLGGELHSCMRNPQQTFTSCDRTKHLGALP